MSEHVSAVPGELGDVQGGALSAELRAQVTAWIADDPDERDRAELTALLAAAENSWATAGDEHANRRRAGRPVRERLEFGTAGLRGAVAAGPNRMNRAVVRAATAALAGWLLEATAAPAPPRRAW